MKKENLYIKDILNDKCSPEEISIPADAKNVVVSFATSSDNIEATAGVLFGAVIPEGEWPIGYKLNK